MMQVVDLLKDRYLEETGEVEVSSLGPGESPTHDWNRNSSRKRRRLGIQLGKECQVLKLYQVLDLYEQSSRKASE